MEIFKNLQASRQSTKENGVHEGWNAVSYLVILMLGVWAWKSTDNVFALYVAVGVMMGLVVVGVVVGNKVGSIYRKYGKKGVAAFYLGKPYEEKAE